MGSLLTRSNQIGDLNSVLKQRQTRFNSLEKPDINGNIRQLSVNHCDYAECLEIDGKSLQQSKTQWINQHHGNVNISTSTSLEGPKTIKTTPEVNPSAITVTCETNAREPEQLSKCKQVYQVFFGHQYESPDVLVIAGVTLVLIGSGATLIGIYVYLSSHQVGSLTPQGSKQMATINLMLLKDA